MKILTQDNQLINYDEVNDVISICDSIPINELPCITNSDSGNFIFLTAKYGNIRLHQLGEYLTKEKAVEVLKQIIEQNDIECKTFIMPKE